MSRAAVRLAPPCALAFARGCALRSSKRRMLKQTRLAQQTPAAAAPLPRRQQARRYPGGAAVAVFAPATPFAGPPVAAPPRASESPEALDAALSVPGASRPRRARVPAGCAATSALAARGAGAARRAGSARFVEAAEPVAADVPLLAPPQALDSGRGRPCQRPVRAFAASALVGVARSRRLLSL